MASESPSVTPVTEATTAQNDSQSATKPSVEENIVDHVERAKQTEQTEQAVSTKQDAPVDSSSNKPEESQNGTDGPLPGDKRSLDEDGTAPTTSNTGLKKQKTEEPEGPPPTTADDAGPNTNGQKKKAGRPKKGTTYAAKQAPPRPTEGIGSRTRSRTKAES